MVAVVAGLAALLGQSGCGVSSPSEDLGVSAAALNANDKIAFDYFLGKGLTPTQAAGIVGNLDVESGMDPTAVQSGGPGRGIAQWSAGARWDTTAGDNVKSYAMSHGADPLSLGLQLDFIWFELTTFPAYGLAKLRAATTVTQAVNAFQSAFEGCGACDSSARVTDAQMALAAYGSDVPADGGGGSGGDAGIACVVTTSGAAGECITTAACMALGDHVSTPGYCPGAADVQCCTALAGSSDGGIARPDGSAGGGGGSGNGTGNNAGSPDGGGGCSTAPDASGGGSGMLLLMGVLLLRQRREARRRARARVEAAAPPPFRYTSHDGTAASGVSGASPRGSLAPSRFVAPMG